jgi:hypothetical protein
MVTAERDVLPLLGKSMDDVAALHWLPSEHDEYVGEDATFWSYQSLGLELSFGNEDGRLQTIFLHSAGHNEFSGFTPPLPLGIVFENDPADIHALLGEPSVSGGGGDVQVIPGRPVPTWSIYRFGAYVLHVQYSPARDHVELVTVMRPDIAPPVGTKH